MRCQGKRTRELTTWARRRTAGKRRPSETKCLTAAEGIAAGRGSVGHDDVPVAVADVAFAGLAFAVAVELPLTVDGHFAFTLARELAVATKGSETERLWGASTLVSVELLAEEANILIVLLADFAMLGLEVVERLANDVELIDLAGDWMLK